MKDASKMKLLKILVEKCTFVTFVVSKIVIHILPNDQMTQNKMLFWKMN